MSELIGPGFTPPYYFLLSERDRLAAENERLKAQIDKLAHFIMDEIPGEPSQSEGSVDCAIRIISKLRAAVGGLSPEAVEWAIRIGIAYTRVVYDDTEANNHAVIAAYQLCPPEVRAQITQGELT